MSLVGHSYGSIADSYATTDVMGGYDDLDKLCDFCDWGDIDDLFMEHDAGGLVGRLDETGEITRSYATGDVTTDGEHAGGLVGESMGSIEDCYAMGNVENLSMTSAGGVVGKAGEESLTERCYGTGAALYHEFGQALDGDPLLHVADTWAVWDELYWDTDTSGMDDSPKGTGLSTISFSNTTTFSGWNFNDVWKIGEAPDGEQRPIFLWQE